MKKIIGLIHKLHFFAVLVVGFWGWLAIDSTLLLSPYYNKILRQAPLGLLAVAEAAWVIGGIIITWRYLTAPEKKGRFALALTYNHILPTVFGIYRAATFNALYEGYSGFMPGLEALGDYVSAVFVIIIAVVTGVIFLICRLVAKKRKAAGKAPFKAIQVIGKVLNLAAAAAVLLVILYYVNFFATDRAKDALENRDVRLAEEYRDKLLGTENPEDKEEDYRYKGMMAAVYTEMLAVQGSNEDLGDDLTDAEKEAISRGAAQWKDLNQHLELARGVEGINIGTHYDYKNHHVICTYPIDFIDRDLSEYVYYYCVVTLSEEAEILSVDYVEETVGKEPWELLQ